MYTYKKCTVCGKWKFIAFFSKTSNGKYYYNRADCKRCHADKKQEWNANNKIKIKQYNIAWRKIHQNYDKEYYKKIKEASYEPR